MTRKQETNAKLKRHPAAIAEDKYQAAKQGSFDPLSLCAPATQRYYLTNRLDAAFQAGWAAAEKHYAKGAKR